MKTERIEILKKWNLILKHYLCSNNIYKCFLQHRNDTSNNKSMTADQKTLQLLKMRTKK